MIASDDEIMAASLGEPARFGEVFDRYFATIHGYLVRRSGRDRADDLAGEVFRVAFGARDRYDPARGGVRPWLYGIANNVLRRHLRDGERAERAWARVAPPGVSDDTEHLDDQLDARFRAAVLQRALDRLLPADREALVLFAVEQLSYAEIAAVMDTPIGTVRSRLSRARAQLRAHLAATDRPVADRLDPDGLDGVDRLTPDHTTPADCPTPDRPAADRPTPDQPAVDRPTPDRPAADRPTPDQPAVDRPTAARPSPEGATRHG